MFNAMRVRLKVFILGHYSKGEANKNSIQGQRSEREDLHLHITVKIRQKALREGNTERRRGPSLPMGSTQRLKGFTHRQYTEIKELHTQAVHGD